MEKIIHQIWFQGIDAVPDRYHGSISSWRQHNPGYKYMFWDESSIDQLLSKNYPHFGPHWRTLDKMIKKCDSARYFILHSFGGVYADLDTTAHRGIDQLVHDLNLYSFDIVLSEESHEPLCWKRGVLKKLGQELATEQVVGNAVLLSRKGQQFWLDFLTEAFQKRNAPVLESFSTWHLTEFLTCGMRNERVKIIPSQYLLSMHFLDGLSYATHDYEATWFDNTKERPWE